MDATHVTSNALVVEHQALVGYQVNALLGRVPACVSRADLVSAGALALVRAARGYDESTGVPFARYASLRIRGALIDELRSMDWVSRAARRRVRQVTEVADQLTGALGRVPSRSELATALGVGVEEIDAARGDAGARVLSLDAFDGAIADSVSSPSMGPEESLLAAERLAALRAGVDALPERLARVVTGLFFHDRPVAELAEELGVSTSRISQLRTEALGLLRDGLSAGPDRRAPAAARDEGVAARRRRAYCAAVARAAAGVAPATALTAAPTQRDGRPAGRPHGSRQTQRESAVA